MGRKASPVFLVWPVKPWVGVHIRMKMKVKFLHLIVSIFKTWTIQYCTLYKWVFSRVPHFRFIRDSHRSAEKIMLFVTICLVFGKDVFFTRIFFPADRWLSRIKRKWGTREKNTYTVLYGSCFENWNACFENYPKTLNCRKTFKSSSISLLVFTFLSHKDENEGKKFALNRFNFQNMNHTIPYKCFFPGYLIFALFAIVIDQRGKNSA
jgi:hypothetical protein